MNVKVNLFFMFDGTLFHHSIKVFLFILVQTKKIIMQMYIVGNENIGIVMVFVDVHSNGSVHEYCNFWLLYVL